MPKCQMVGPDKDQAQPLTVRDNSHAASRLQFMAAMELMAPSAASPSFLPEDTGTGVMLHSWSAGSKPPLNQVGGPFWKAERQWLVHQPPVQRELNRPTTMRHARNLLPFSPDSRCLLGASLPAK